MHLNELAKLMRTVGDENRLRIMCHLLKRGELCVSDIAEDLQISVANVSHHLQVMTKDKLLEATRDGKRICYTLPKTYFVLDLKKFISAHVNFNNQ